MKQRQFVFIGVFIFIFALTVLGRNLIRFLIAAPLTYLWWILKSWYADVSQPVVWIALVALVGTSGLISILPALGFEMRERVKVKTAQGQIEQLANLIAESQQGPYFDKWLLANRLGGNAGEILAQREGRPMAKIFGALRSPNWNPPPQIETYLNTGLQSSMQGRRDRRWSLRGKRLPPTPLDINLDEVVQYLESETRE